MYVRPLVSKNRDKTKKIEHNAQNHDGICLIVEVLSLTMVNGRAKKNHQVRPALQEVGNIIPQGTREGGLTAPYALEIRRLAALVVNQGLEQHPIILEARRRRIYPHPTTVRRWFHREHSYGHIQSFKRTGNRCSKVLKGPELVLLILFTKKYPTATGLEKAAFLFNSWGRFQRRPRLFSESQICRAEQSAGLSRKRTSTSAFRAFYPEVLIRRLIFWTLPYPLGISDIPLADLLDLDECRVVLEMANRGLAKIIIGSRSRVVGHYKGPGRLGVAAVSADGRGRRWLILEDRAGTNLELIVRFVRELLASLGPARNGYR